MVNTKKEVISIFVDNQSMVLARVVNLFSRRGFNIDSLTVSTTKDPNVSRITVVFEGNDLALNQIITQTQKLEVVKSVSLMEKKESIFRELLLLKVAVDDSNRTALKDIIDVYRGRIIDLTTDSLVIEMTGEPTKIDAFLKMLPNYEVLDICRTGITAMERGWIDE